MFYMRVAILPNNMHGKGRQKEFLACVSSQWLIGKRREEETTAGLLIYDHGRHHTGQDNGLEHHQRLWCEPLKCYICFFFLVQECPQLHLLSSTLIHVSRMNGMSLARADRIFKVLNVAEQALPKPVAHWIPAEWNVKKIHTHTRCYFAHKRFDSRKEVITAKEKKMRDGKMKDVAPFRNKSKLSSFLSSPTTVYDYIRKVKRRKGRSPNRKEDRERLSLSLFLL